MQWLNENMGTILIWVSGILGVLVAVSAVVGKIDAKWARTLTGILGVVIMILRRISGVPFENEKGSVSVPLIQGDSGTLVEVVEDPKP